MMMNKRPYGAFYFVWKGVNTLHEVILTEEQLRARCEEWKKTLRLQDWIVSVGISRARDMKLDNSSGECEWSLPKRMVNIRILDPVDYPPDSMEPQDMELTLVHELLHLHFAPMSTEDNVVPEEQAIEAISRGLIDLARRGGEQEHVERNDLRRDVGADSAAV